MKKLVHRLILKQLEAKLNEEWITLNEKLDRNGISALPDGFYKGAKKLSDEEVNKLI